MKYINLALIFLITIFTFNNCIHLRNKHHSLIFSKIHSHTEQTSCNNQTIINGQLSLADMLKLTENEIQQDCNCASQLMTDVNSAISYIDGLTDTDIANIIQTLNQTKVLILKVKKYLINTGQNSFIQLSAVKRNLKNIVKNLIELTKDKKFKLIDIDVKNLMMTQSTENKWQLTMDTITTLDSLMIWFDNLKSNKSQLITILNWIQYDCNANVSSNTTTSNNTNTTYVDPDRPNNTDPAYDFANKSMQMVQILLQGDDNLYLEYTSDYKNYIFVGSTQQWDKRLTFNFSVQRGVGKFRVSVNNIGGPGGFVGRLIIDNVSFYTNLDNFKPSPENTYTTFNQYDSSMDSGWNASNLGFNGGFWIWPSWSLVGKASYDFAIPLVCSQGYVQFYQKCFLDEPFMFDNFHFLPSDEFDSQILNSNMQIISTKNKDAAAFTQRPIKDEEYFGVERVTNDNFAIGLCLKETNFISEKSTNIIDDKTALIKNNHFAFGVTYTSNDLIQWSLGNSTSQSLSSLNKYCNNPNSCSVQGFWFQYFLDSNSIKVQFKNYKPVIKKLPNMLIGRRLYPCVQVWGNNKVNILSSSEHP